MEARNTRSSTPSDGSVAATQLSRERTCETVRRGPNIEGSPNGLDVGWYWSCPACGTVMDAVRYIGGTVTCYKCNERMMLLNESLLHRLSGTKKRSILKTVGRAIRTMVNSARRNTRRHAVNSIRREKGSERRARRVVVHQYTKVSLRLNNTKHHGAGTAAALQQDRRPVRTAREEIQRAIATAKKRRLP